MIVRLRNFNPSNPCLGEMCMGFKARKWCVALRPARKAAYMPRPGGSCRRRQTRRQHHSATSANYVAMQEIVEQTIFRSTPAWPQSRCRCRCPVVMGSPMDDASRAHGPPVKNGGMCLLIHWLLTTGWISVGYTLASLMIRRSSTYCGLLSCRSVDQFDY